MTAVVVVAGLGAVAAGALRWLRVAQREHYIAGSCTAVALRWLRVRPASLWGLLVALGAWAVAAVAGLAGVDGLAAGAALLALAAAAVFPWGMPLLGSPRLRFTRRATTLTAVVAVIALVVAVLGVVAGVPEIVLPVLALAVPLLVDGALAATAPVEARALERHRRAAAARLRRVAPRVIAVTGSYGKTTTKGHIRDLLSDDVAVVASPASWNNTAGLARTINEYLLDDTEVLVAEMGMYRKGEIRALTSWVPPDVAVITAIGPMHLERAGSMEAIVEAKAEILERASVAVLWVEDERLRRLADECTIKLWRVGLRGRDDLDVEVEVEGDTLVVSAAGAEVGRCPLRPGLHPGNVGCAVAAVLASGIDVRHLGRRLATLSAPSHRSTSEVTDTGLRVIDDTFNSNPSGARAALDALASQAAGRRAVVTPGMVELGPAQETENAAFARDVVASGAELVVVGWTNRRSLSAGAGGHATLVPNRKEGAAWVRSNLGAGDAVLWENDLPDHYP
jgi:UDP-N-acetylmuramoyl-tripeptide--D-alanyl-D-alanine ligase